MLSGVSWGNEVKVMTYPWERLGRGEKESGCEYGVGRYDEGTHS